MALCRAVKAPLRRSRRPSRVQQRRAPSAPGSPRPCRRGGAATGGVCGTRVPWPLRRLHRTPRARAGGEGPTRVSRPRQQLRAGPTGERLRSPSRLGSGGGGQALAESPRAVRRPCKGGQGHGARRCRRYGGPAAAARRLAPASPCAPGPAGRPSPPQARAAHRLAPRWRGRLPGLPRRRRLAPVASPRPPSSAAACRLCSPLTHRRVTARLATVQAYHRRRPQPQGQPRGCRPSPSRGPGWAVPGGSCPPRAPGKVVRPHALAALRARGPAAVQSLSGPAIGPGGPLRSCCEQPRRATTRRR